MKEINKEKKEKDLEHILKSLERHGNISRIARELGTNRMYIYRLLREKKD